MTSIAPVRVSRNAVSSKSADEQPPVAERPKTPPSTARAGIDGIKARTEKQSTRTASKGESLAPRGKTVSGAAAAVRSNLDQADEPLFELGRVQFVLSEGAIDHGDKPLPYHPSGERYTSLPYVGPEGKQKVNLIGLTRPRDHKFEVFDISDGKHQSLGLIDRTKSDNPVVTDPVRALGGGLFGSNKKSKKTSGRVNYDSHGRPLEPLSFQQSSSSSYQPPPRPLSFQTVPEGYEISPATHPLSMPAHPSSSRAPAPLVQPWNSTQGPSGSRLPSVSSRAPTHLVQPWNSVHGPSGSSLPSTSGTSVIDRAIDSLNATNAIGGRPITRADIQARNYAIPSRVYRAAYEDAEDVAEYGIERAGTPPASRDAYLADILRHTARTGGSGGRVPSFSANRSTSQRFLRSNPTMVEVSTRYDPDGFRTAASIILRDAQRLVEDGHVSAATVGRAIANLVNEDEDELFYVRGDLPPDMITSIESYRASSSSGRRR